VESKSAKYAFWGTVFAAIITGAIGLYIHLDGKEDKTKIIEQQRIIEQKKEAEQSKNTASLNISKVNMPPINTSQDSSFFVEIKNNSLNIAKDITVKINFGEASVTSCETLPKNVFQKEQNYNTSIISFPVGDIQKSDKFYVYCLISNPVFESILISGSNLFSNQVFEYKNLKREVKIESSGFLTFFKVVATIVAVIFTIYFTIATISFLNKKLNVDI
jgi:hypothetical protein